MYLTKSKKIRKNVKTKRIIIKKKNRNKSKRQKGGDIPQKIFMTFGDSSFVNRSENYLNAGKRLKSQAEKTKIFDKCLHFTNADLMNDIDFWDQHYNFINNNKRGNGYWIWKSYLIKKTIEKLNDGDMLVYLDVGCEIDYKKTDKIKTYMEKLKEYPILKTDVSCVEKCWCKQDLINKMKPSEDDLNSYQIQSGAMMFLVNPITKKLVNEWYNYSRNYYNLDDSDSELKNDECFKEHRHDQSIFSLLVKKYKLNNNISLHDVFNYARNRSGVSILK